MNDTFKPRQLAEEQYTEPVELPIGDTQPCYDLPLQSKPNIQKQFAEKIKAQALLLDKQEKYISLCEKRILELFPDHPLPIELKHFGKLNSAYQSQTERPNQYYELKKALAYKDQELHFAQLKIDQLNQEDNHSHVGSNQDVYNLEKALRIETLANEEQRNYIKILQNEINDTKKEQGIEGCKNKMQQLANSNKQYSEQIEKLQNENESFQAKIIELNDQLEEAQQSLQTANLQVQEKSKIVESLTNDANKSIQKINDLHKEIIEVQHKNELIKSDLEKSQKDMKEKLNTIMQYKDELEKCKLTNNECIAKFKSDIEGYQTSNKRLSDEIEVLKKSQTSYSEQKNTLENEKLSNIEKIKELELNISSYQLKNAKISDELERNRKDLQELEATKEQYEKFKKEATDQINNLKNELESSFKKNTKLANDLTDTQKELLNQSKCVNNLKEDLEKVKRNENAQICSLKKQIAEYKQENERISEELKSATSYKSELEIHKNKNLEIIQKLQRDIELHQQKNVTISEELNNTKHDLVTQSQVANNYKSQIDQLKTEFEHSMLQDQSNELFHDKENTLDSQIKCCRNALQASPLHKKSKCSQCSEAATYIHSIITHINQFVLKINSNTQFACTMKAQLTSQIKEALVKSDLLTSHCSIPLSIQRASEWIRLFINEIEQLTIAFIQLKVENSLLGKKVERFRKSISLSTCEEDAGSKINQSEILASHVASKSFTSLKKPKGKYEANHKLSAHNIALDRSIDI